MSNLWTEWRIRTETDEAAVWTETEARRKRVETGGWVGEGYVEDNEDGPSVSLDRIFSDLYVHDTIISVMPKIPCAKDDLIRPNS